MKYAVKRVYDSAAESDGFRILVDRLWPRGVKKEDAHINLWLKEIAPSTSLRKWFNHEDEKWNDFKEKYIEELKQNPAVLQQLKKEIEGQKKVTLVYGAKNEKHNQAVVLKGFLEE